MRRLLFFTTPRFILLLFSFCAAISGKAQNETGCEILSHIRHITLDGNKLIRTDSVVVKIYDQRGDRRSHIQIHYSKGDKVTVHYAYIEDRNGTVVRKIKRNEITDVNYVSNASLYQDDFIRSFELKHNVYPYQVKYSYTIIEDEYFYVGGLPYSGEDPVKEGLFVVRTNSGQPVKYKQEHVEEPRVETSGDETTYAWIYRYAYEKPDIYTSDDFLKKPHITVLPLNFSYGVHGNWDSWEAFGNYIYRLNDGLDALPQTEKTRIDKLLQGTDDKRERVRILYHYLQDNHRYVNITLGIGGLKSYPVEYVCTNRFGDCKALSNYMVGILKYAGIEAYHTLVRSSGRVPEFYKEFPAQVFDHMIATVPMGADTIYLECTASKWPFNALGTSLQGGMALLVKEHGSHLVDLPAPAPDQVNCRTIFNVDLLSGQDVKIAMNSLSRGREFERYNYFMETSTRSQIDHFIRNSIFQGTFDLLDYEFRKAGRDSDSIRLAVNGEVKNFYRKYGNNLVLNTFTFSLPAFESPETRKAPVRFDYPSNEEYVINYRLGDIVPVKVPQPVIIESPFGIYKCSSEWAEGIMSVRKTLTINAGVIPMEDYAAFYGFISEIRSRENPNYKLEIK